MEEGEAEAEDDTNMFEEDDADFLGGIIMEPIDDNDAPVIDAAMMIVSVKGVVVKYDPQNDGVVVALTIHATDGGANRKTTSKKIKSQRKIFPFLLPAFEYIIEPASIEDKRDPIVVAVILKKQTLPVFTRDVLLAMIHKFFPSKETKMYLDQRDSHVRDTYAAFEPCDLRIPLLITHATTLIGNTRRCAAYYALHIIFPSVEFMDDVAIETLYSMLQTPKGRLIVFTGIRPARDFDITKLMRISHILDGKISDAEFAMLKAYHELIGANVYVSPVEEDPTATGEHARRIQQRIQLIETLRGAQAIIRCAKTNATTDEHIYMSPVMIKAVFGIYDILRERVTVVTHTPTVSGTYGDGDGIIAAMRSWCNQAGEEFPSNMNEQVCYIAPNRPLALYWSERTGHAYSTFTEIMRTGVSGAPDRLRFIVLDVFHAYTFQQIYALFTRMNTLPRARIVVSLRPARVSPTANIGLSIDACIGRWLSAQMAPQTTLSGNVCAAEIIDISGATDVVKRMLELIQTHKNDVLFVCETSSDENTLRACLGSRTDAHVLSVGDSVVGADRTQLVIEKIMSRTQGGTMSVDTRGHDQLSLKFYGVIDWLTIRDPRRRCSWAFSKYALAQIDAQAFHPRKHAVLITFGNTIRRESLATLAYLTAPTPVSAASGSGGGGAMIMKPREAVVVDGDVSVSQRVEIFKYV
jgi:hypothetical protein